MKKENKAKRLHTREQIWLSPIKVGEVGLKFDLELPSSQSKDRNTIWFKIYSIHRRKQARKDLVIIGFGARKKFFPVGIPKGASLSSARLVILQSPPHQAGLAYRAGAQSIPCSQGSVQGGPGQGHPFFTLRSRGGHSTGNTLLSGVKSCPNPHLWTFPRAVLAALL